MTCRGERQTALRIKVILVICAECKGVMLALALQRERLPQFLSLIDGLEVNVSSHVLSSK